MIITSFVRSVYQLKNPRMHVLDNGPGILLVTHKVYNLSKFVVSQYEVSYQNKNPVCFTNIKAFSECQFMSKYNYHNYCAKVYLTTWITKIFLSEFHTYCTILGALCQNFTC